MDTVALRVPVVDALREREVLRVGENEGEGAGEREPLREAVAVGEGLRLRVGDGDGSVGVAEGVAVAVVVRASVREAEGVAEVVAVHEALAEVVDEPVRVRELALVVGEKVGLGSTERDSVLLGADALRVQVALMLLLRVTVQEPVASGD